MGGSTLNSQVLTSRESHCRSWNAPHAPLQKALPPSWLPVSHLLISPQSSVIFLYFLTLSGWPCIYLIESVGPSEDNLHMIPHKSTTLNAPEPYVLHLLPCNNGVLPSTANPPTCALDPIPFHQLKETAPSILHILYHQSFPLLGHHQQHTNMI